jgi:hypothetical protein
MFLPLVLLDYFLFWCHMIWSYSNGAGKTVSVNEKTRITVPEDRYGLYAIDTLDPDMVRRYLFGSFIIVLLFCKVGHQTIAACRSTCLWCLFNFLSLNLWLCAVWFLVIITILDYFLFCLLLAGIQLVANSETGLSHLIIDSIQTSNKCMYCSGSLIS